MRHSRMVKMALLGMAGFVAVMAGGCTAPKSGDRASKKQSLTVKGSDTMVQLAQAWAEEFMKEHPDFMVSVTGGGSNTGIAALMNKGTDICNSSRAITETEKSDARTKGIEIQEHIVAQDALAVIVHPSNPISELTMQQLRDIFTGKVTNWKQLGGQDRAIVLNSRETSSGSYVFFQEHVLGKGVPFADTAMLQPSTSQIVQNVSQDAGGIGYVGLGYVNASVKPLKIKKNEASPAVAPNEADVLNGTYPLARPLFEYTAGEPTGAIKTWLDWVRGPKGQEIVKKLGFVPVEVHTGG